MKLLIITQKVDKNDSDLSFFHRWIEEFAKQTDEVFVVSQFVGNYDLPENAKVFSLGKEKEFSKIRQLFNFYKLLFKNLSKIDAVFVHMIPMWAVLGWPIFKVKRKKVFLWYTHKSVNFWLKFAEKMVFKIFTASSESFRLSSKKVMVIGHGIDVDKFKAQSPQKESLWLPTGQAKLKATVKNFKLKIISVGRIAEAKNQKKLLEAADILARQKNFRNFEIEIIGGPILERDFEYFKNLKKFVSEKKLEEFVEFIGDVPHENIQDYYEKADIFIHLSKTGSIDKVVLEALVVGVPVYSSSEAFKDILPSQFLISGDPKELAEKIASFTPPSHETTSALRDYVVQNHSLNNLIFKIIKEINAA